MKMEEKLMEMKKVRKFRKRRWGGEIMKKNVNVRMDLIEKEKRNVNDVEDNKEVK